MPIDLRILPLLASATEIVHALGLGQFQIGRSHECDFPACVTKLPVCSSAAIPVSGSSAEIDRLVRQRIANALSIYNVDSDLIANLRPSHIITQTQCKVCAVSLEDVELALQKQIGTNAKVISLEPYSLNDIWADIRRIGSGCGFPERGEDLIASMQSKMLPLDVNHRPRVACLEWLEPVMYAGNWMPELIQMAGGEPSTLEANPDVIVAMPCGFDLERTRAEMHWIQDRVQGAQVFLVDGNQYMNRPGPRLVESYQILCHIIHSDAYPPPATIASGWEVFTR